MRWELDYRNDPSNYKESDMAQEVRVNSVTKHDKPMMGGLSYMSVRLGHWG